MPPKKLTDLKVSPDNPREIQADRMAALVRSLREDPEMMQARPLLVRKDGTVIAGNMRLLAARELGWETIPTITVDLTDERARLWMLRDNNAYGEWEDEALAGLLLAMQEDGTDLELTGFGADEIDKLLASVGPHETDADPDAVPDVPEEAESKLGEVYELGRHRLMCGDATSAEDVAKLMGGGVCHCVFTSPPYALGVDYGSYVDDLEHLRVLLPSAVSVWTSLVVAGGYFVVNFSDVVAAQEIAGTDEPCEYPMAVEYWPVFRGAGWLLHTRRIWQKPHVRVHSPWAIKSSRSAM